MWIAFVICEMKLSCLMAASSMEPCVLKMK